MIIVRFSDFLKDRGIIGFVIKARVIRQNAECTFLGDFFCADFRTCRQAVRHCQSGQIIFLAFVVGEF